ncbi:MAG TPA: M56 family metallopeptidase [Terriglobia bacterium]|nr:M56 family metallopeptidase [Terriglobia bacterium]
MNRRLVAIYFLLLTFLLGRLVLGQALSRHLRRQSRPVQDPKARAHNQQAAMRVGLKGPPELAESSAICVPVTLGVLRPVILIPTEWRDWSEAKLVVVMVHEISHIRRKDSLTRLVALVYQCFFWFSPLAWWLAAKLAELAEQASDQAAIRAGTEPTFYAEVLLDFIRSLNHHQRRTCWQAVPMARGGRAHERIGRILASQETLMNELRKPVLILFAAFAAPFVWLLASCHPVVVARPLLSQAHAPLTLHGESEGHILLLGSLAPLAATSATPSQSLHIGSGGASAIASRQPVPAAAAPQSQHDEQRSFHSDWDMDIAIISPRSIIAFGSSDDREHAATLREKMPGEFIWFLHDGNSFLIRDARTVQAAKALAAPMEELEKGQAALGKQEEELRSRQVELDEKMKAMRVNLPADLAARQDRLKTLIQQIRPTASRQQLAGLERHLGELQGEIGQLEGKAGTVDGAVGVWERSLAAQEGKLGRQEREFGKQEVLVAKETSQRLQALLDSALANGLAKSERR